MVKLWSFTSATLGCRCFPHIIMVSALISLAAISLSTHFSVYLCIDLSSSWDCTMPCNTHVFCIFESHFPSFENAFHTAWPNSFFFFKTLNFWERLNCFLAQSKRVILSARALAPLWREIWYFVNCMPFSPLMLLEKLLLFFISLHLTIKNNIWIVYPLHPRWSSSSQRVKVVHTLRESCSRAPPYLFAMRREYGSTKRVCQRHACSAVCLRAAGRPA